MMGMTMSRILMLVLMVVSWSEMARGQETTSRTANDLVKATDWSVPTSPAFTLLGVNPAKVSKPGFARDINLDLIVKEDQLISDLAIEVQPLWLLLYEDISLSEYARQNAVQRAASSLSLSLATSDRDSVNVAAYGARLTLYRQSDPMLDATYLSAVKNALAFTEDAELEKSRRAKADDIEFIDEELADPGLTDSTRSELEHRRTELKVEMTADDIRRQQIKVDEEKRIKEAEESFVRDHWNDTMVDLGFGQMFEYRSSTLDSLAFEAKGTGVWVNASLGLGSNAMLSVLVKHVDIADADETLLGGNLRYGGPVGSAFVEYVYEEIGDSLKRTLSYGGEFRIDGKKVVEAGIRTEYNSAWDLYDLIPQVKFKWAFARDIFK